MHAPRRWWQRFDPELGITILCAVTFFVVGYVIALVQTVAP